MTGTHTKAAIFGRSRFALLAALALSAFVLAPESALADCTVTQGGGVTCNASTVTTPATLLDAGGLPSTTTSDQIIQFDNGTPITASVNAVTMSGYGMELLQTGATSGTIDLINNAGSLITSDPGNGTAAVALVGNSGKITYSSSGSITGSDNDGIYASNTGTGQISIVTTGIIAAGDNSGGDDYGIYTTAQNGATTINLDHGGTIEGATTGGLADGAGIYSRSVGGNVTITADDIGADATDRAYTGIDAAITGNASGQLSVTGVGTIYVTQTGISAVNNNLGGIIVNLNSGATIDISRGIATVGEYVRDTGSAGGITVTNQVGSLIDPDIGVDAQITNNANNGNVIVDQEGTVIGNVTGIIAGTNGNGNIHVYGAGDVTGGSGVYFLNTATPVSANNAGIVAIQNGTAGSVTIEGSGATSATAAIIGEITNASNSSAIVIDRSGAISVTGAGGFGVLATTQGLGSVTVQDTGDIAGSGGGTVAFGIDAVASGGNVLVKDVSDITADATDGYGISASTIGNGTVTVSGTGAITAAGNGISATTSGGGKVTVSGTGAIIADSDSSTVGTGIIATSVGGDITVTPGSTVAGANGIDAETNSNGAVTVTTGGNVTATTSYGVKTVAQDGATLVTANVGGIQGNTFGVESTSDDGKITITGSKTYTGGSGPAISATMNGPTGTGAGNDGILISGTGNTSTTGAGDGIDASITAAGNHSNIDITRSGTVTAGANGILATTLGDGNVTVTNTGNVSGTTGTGIDAESQGGNIIVTPSGTVSDANGILGSTVAGGTVTVTTAFGAAGNVTGTTGFGIQTSADDGNTYITNNATTVQGATYAVNATSNGTGGISVIGAGDYTGGSSGGIYAVILGTGPSGASGVGPGGTNGIFISGSGKTTTTDGDAIHAHEAGGTASILVNRTGLVTVTDTAGGGDGIYAVTAGSGNVTVTNVTGVSAGHGAAAIGIDAESNGGNIIVTPAGTVVGGNGIKATTASGSGTVLVQTIAGAAGNVTGLDGYGVLTSSDNGNTIVNNKAALISGTTWGDNSTSTGTGTLTIEGAGDYSGDTAGGIGAFMTGGGPGSGNTGIYITGTGNTSSVSGYGIDANISNPGNDSDIVIDRNGTVTVGSGGADGIYAHTSGTGNVLIHDISNVQGGTGPAAHGIDAASSGGNVTVDLSTPLLNSATVSGGNGISAVTINGDNVVVTTYTGTAGNVTGSNGYGVSTSAVGGTTVVTNNAQTISGTTWADTSTVSGLGTIEITDSGVAGNGNFVGGSAGGISAVDTGTGPSAGIGPNSDAAIWISGSGNTSGTAGTGIFAQINNVLNGGSILIDRTGTVSDTGGNGIVAEITNGTGNVTVTGTGAVTADDTGTGITALALTGDVTVTPSSTVYGSAGIDAETGGTGTVTVTTLGDITGTYGDGIHAASVNGDINVTTAAGTLVAGDFGGAGTGDGIDARASGSGNVHVIANSDVSGDPGIIVTSATGNAWATANGTVTGLLEGVYAEVTSGAATSFVLVDGTGNVTGGTTGIYANNNGSGNTTVTGGGNTIGNNGDGIIAETNTGNVLVDRNGTVTGSQTGIYATSSGGDVTVNGVGNVLGDTTGLGYYGIYAVSSGGSGDVSVTPAGTVEGDTGIYARAHNAGTVTVTTASGSGGDVTGDFGDGIHAHAHDGNIAITNNAALVQGSDDGAFAVSTGLGAITVDGAGTYTGGTGDGIDARMYGGGPAAGSGVSPSLDAGIWITGTGNTTTTSGVGINAYINSGSNGSDIVIDRSGTVTVGASGGDGIDAVTNGTGNISVDGVGNVTAGTAGSTTGIYAEAMGGGDVSVTPAGTVTGSNDGIYARAHSAGTVTVVTASGIGGNVTGTNGDGIHAHSHDGNLSVTNNAATVQGGVNGVNAVTTGLGTITVDGGGTYAGDTGDGIEARMYGNGPASGTGIHISGSGNATTNTGVGIYALINSISNASDIVIDRTGTVTVGSGGGDGVYALTNGAGDVSVTGTGAVTAGTGLGDTGIYAIASGGDVTVEPASTVYGGGMGIDAETVLTGTVTVTTHGDITGNTDDGIHARTADGDIHVTTAASTKVWGDKSGSGSGDGIDARASGAGNVIVDSEGVVEGDPGEILSSATGNVDLTENGAVTGDVGRGIDAQVTSSGAASYVKVTGAGNVLGATDGIYAKNAGSGNTTVSGSGNAEGDNGDGIDAYTVAGNVLVNRTGTVTAAKTGIDAESSGGGSVTVTGTGNVLANTGAGGYTGIIAKSSGGNGNVSVTPSGTVSGASGIFAQAAGAGTVTVTTAAGAAGNVTGTAGNGIYTNSLNGNIIVTNNAVLVSGSVAGAYAETDGIGAITVGGPGTYHGGAGDGIQAAMYGNGPALGSGVSPSTNAGIWITGSGNTTSTSGVGISAYIDLVSSVSDIVIDRSGSVMVGAGGGNGINAVTNGTGNIFVTGTGAVTGGASANGIHAIAAGGNVDVEPASTVWGGVYGIDAETTGSGTVTVITHGDITGNTDDGIHARSQNGDINVTTAASTTVTGDASHTGFGDGIDARASGSGNVHVIANSAVYGDPAIIVTSATGNAWATANAITNGLTYGVYARVTGPAATSYTLVDGSGNVTGGTTGIWADNDGHGTTTVSGSGNTIGNNGDGIDAYAIDGAVLVNRTGTVTGSKNGIDAETSGGGSVTVTGTGNVLGDITGGSNFGILAEQSGGNGAVSVTPAGTVKSDTGIVAVAAGTGSVTVTTASGATGNVTGTAYDGIDATSADGTITVTNNATTVSGHITGLFALSNALSTGDGAISILGSGTFAGSTGDGIDAEMLGHGPAFGSNGISISGSVNASTTSGRGIDAHIDSASNASTISITTTGTVTVATSGSDGIHALTIGGGNVTIGTTNSNVGNVTAGTGATGIYATTTGGNGSVSIATNGTISGARGVYASAVGSGTVTVTVPHNTAGNAGNGIETSAVNGATHVNVNSATTTGSTSGKAGVNETASGSGGLFLTVASGATVTGGTTAGGVKMSQTGTGSNSITNTGNITGAGTSANPVISVGSTASGSTTITNNSGGVIQSTNGTANNRPADLAILSSTTTGSDSIVNHGTLNGQIKLSNATNSMNNSGTWNVRDNTGTAILAAAFGSGGNNSLINSATINAGNALATATSTFTGIQTINNSGTINAGLFGTSDVTTFDASGNVQSVTNTGVINVHGTLNFVGDASFNNAGGIIDMRTSGSATTDVTGLNVTASGNTYSPGVAYNFAGGTNSRLGLDTFVGQLSSAGSTVPSDRLLISGTATLTTGILLNDVNAASGSYNPIGITLVGVNGASTDAFYLQSLTSTSPYDALETGFGPMGAVKKGFWVYPLLQSTHAEAVANGLTGASSSEYRLYGLPDVEAYQLPLAITGAQNIWYETAAGWDERQEEARRYWDVYADRRSKDSGKSADIWLKATGSWTKRDVTHDQSALVPAASVLDPVITDFKQDVGSIQLGVDGQVSGTRDGAFVLGASVGYVASTLDFSNTNNSFAYTGGIIDATADYYNGPWFVDVLAKVDLLQTQLKFNSLVPFGYVNKTVNTNTYGALSSAGYHFVIDRDHSGHTYLEPLITLSYTQSNLDKLSELGTTVNFDNGETFRGAIGARLGTLMGQKTSFYLDGSLTAQYWDEFTNSTDVILSSAGPALSLDDKGRQSGFGSVTGMLDIADGDSGWSGFLNGGAKFNSEFTTLELKGGVRYQW